MTDHKVPSRFAGRKTIQVIPSVSLVVALISVVISVLSWYASSRQADTADAALRLAKQAAKPSVAIESLEVTNRDPSTRSFTVTATVKNFGGGRADSLRGDFAVYVVRTTSEFGELGGSAPILQNEGLVLILPPGAAKTIIFDAHFDTDESYRSIEDGRTHVDVSIRLLYKSRNMSTDAVHTYWYRYHPTDKWLSIMKDEQSDPD